MVMMNYSLSFANPNPNLSTLTLINNNNNNNLTSPSSMASYLSLSSSSFSLRLESHHSRWRVSSITGILPLPPPPRKLAVISIRSGRRSFVSFAASHEESKPSEGDLEMEKNDVEGGKASQEAWEQALASFKEQALKLQSVSQEAYEVYSEKATVALKETAETLKIQADQARQDLAVMAKDLSVNGRDYLIEAAENSPEPVKDVVETFASTENLDDVSKVRDFYIGIPYGTILSAGGFLNFMLTGSISALRFGVILGGILLALSVSSLRSWKRGESTETILKGQAAVAGILFLRDINLAFQGLTLIGLLKTIISGAVAAFFVYRITYDHSPRLPNVDGEASS